MQKLTRPFLTISTFLLLLLSSCGSKITDGYTPKTDHQKSVTIPYFTDSERDYVYKTNITVYGNELSGIFIAKKINESTHRVVFTTEFGNKLLDFEISETTFKVNSIVDELDRKILINTLTNDFRLLLKAEFKIEKAFENDEYTVYQTADQKELDYIFVSKASNGVEKVIQGTERKEKITVFFTSENNIFANQIKIEHQNIKLKIELKHLDPNSN